MSDFGIGGIECSLKGVCPTVASFRESSGGWRAGGVGGGRLGIADVAAGSGAGVGGAGVRGGLIYEGVWDKMAKKVDGGGAFVASGCFSNAVEEVIGVKFSCRFI